MQYLYNTILEYIGMDCVISELCYKGTILQWNKRKLTMQTFGSHDINMLYPNPCHERTAFYFILSVISHINYIVARCLINVAYLTANRAA